MCNKHFVSDEISEKNVELHSIQAMANDDTGELRESSKIEFAQHDDSDFNGIRVWEEGLHSRKHMANGLGLTRRTCRLEASEALEEAVSLKGEIALYKYLWRKE
jgi:hypothetical protein